MILSICSNPNTLRVFKYVNLVITLIKILVPVALIISLMIDFMKEVTNGERDFHKVSNLVVKKLVAAVLVFMVPTLVNIIANVNGFDTNNFVSCLNNATNEKIEELQIEYTERLINKYKDNFDNGSYAIIKTEVYKIKDEAKKEELTNQINKLKEEYEEKRKEKEQYQNANSAAGKIVVEAMKLANDDSHGYCNRVDCNTFPDLDCGTFVSFALQYAGLVPQGTMMNPNDPTVAISQLQSHGFQMYSFDRSKLQPGDIVIRYGHTEIYIGNNQTVGAHGNSAADGPLTGECGCVSGPGTQQGDQGGEVSVTGLSDYTNIIRYVGK